MSINKISFKTGDIITARNTKIVICHKAIVLRLNNTTYFLHNSPDKKNEFGGNILLDTADDFFRRRVFVRKENSSLTRSEIIQK